MVSVEKISLHFGGFELFREINFLINSRDRIGLTGKNGAGKTTLLKIIAGIDQPSSGKVSLPKELTIGYLPQQMAVTDTHTVWEEAKLAFAPLLALKEELEALNHDILVRRDFHSETYLRLLEVVHEKSDLYRILGGDNYEAELEQTLIGLGFERSDFGRKTAEFSGGWRMRIELAKLLLRKPDLFLLDEPTNHLDIESIQWLEDFLRNYRGAVVLVSHDRAFLDNVTTRTIEISLGRISDQKMNYSSFVKWKGEQREQQLAAYRNQQKMIEETERFIERFRYKATKAVQVQSRIKALDRIDRLEIEPEDDAFLNIRFAPAPRSGQVVTECRSVSKSYGSLKVLEHIDLTIERGNKVAFVGRNGEGKTTLARIIMGEIGYTGSVKTGHNVKTGYFAQNQADLLDQNLTVLETIDRVAVGEIRTKIRDLLGAFLFSGEDVDKKVSVLSGGERSRLAMIRLLLEPVNFLVLDEPTNHLDMRSKELLKKALIAFDGTILVVSHDREFLDGLVDCVYEFRDKKIRQHLGGIYDFLRKKKLDSLRQLEARATPTAGQGAAESLKSTGEEGEPGISFEEKKNINRSISRIERSIAAREESIASLEKELAAMDLLLSGSSGITPADVFEKYEAKREELADAFREWEREHEELEIWKAKKRW
ncbi:MAG TPA: ABC-F family ATP-binding cassette domain-containing protein [Prolixibacteraceae bacterium]|nr:ABC-F family ATP-binding cassette domain-containing protein [Prolixibacteraceae bacterium]HQE53063.1 ABC-F family ATP-binding cassette domain-containing protein [Prolixibacteraceae bacterium]HQH75311.1 ABC-F family ATP-binding cassette domain-containing protein [Prolixibacteraceae bacterium]HQJ86606.1 ABC-F family ATP-binding cassette domain-containing protein [Prolixibacteraceae bacterium]